MCRTSYCACDRPKQNSHQRPQHSSHCNEDVKLWFGLITGVITPFCHGRGHKNHQKKRVMNLWSLCSVGGRKKKEWKWKWLRSYFIEKEEWNKINKGQTYISNQIKGMEILAIIDMQGHLQICNCHGNTNY